MDQTKFFTALYWQNDKQTSLNFVLIARYYNEALSPSTNTEIESRLGCNIIFEPYNSRSLDYICDWLCAPIQLLYLNFKVYFATLVPSIKSKYFPGIVMLDSNSHWYFYVLCWKEFSTLIFCTLTSLFSFFLKGESMKL